MDPSNQLQTMQNPQNENLPQQQIVFQNQPISIENTEYSNHPESNRHQY